MNDNSSQPISGSCLCGAVRYRFTGNLGIFQNCQCSRCRKFTGSAFAANLFVSPEQFHWLAGESHIGRYAPEETRHFTTAFCKNCGSSLPWHAKSGKVVVVPAGTLDQHPGIEPSQHIFCASRADWYHPEAKLPEYDELPPRK